MDDIWGDDSDVEAPTETDSFSTPLLESFKGQTGMGVATEKAMVLKMAKEGYVEGKAEQEKVEMQLGFDEGFHRGQVLGRLCGRVYGEVRKRHADALLTASSTGGDGNSDGAEQRLEKLSVILQRIERIFFLEFPDVLKARSMDKGAGAALTKQYAAELYSLLSGGGGDGGGVIATAAFDVFIKELEGIE